MGRISEVLQFVRSFVNGVPVGEVKADPGGGAIKTLEHFGPSGDDSPPLPGDSVASQPSVETGVEQVVGYHDPKNEGQAQPGEKRLYSRAQDGTPSAQVWQKNDGTIVIECLKDSAPIEIRTTGPVTVHSPSVRLGNAPGRRVACEGDLVAVAVPQLLSTAPGNPVAPVPSTAVTPTGGYVATGQIISGRPGVTAGTE